MKTFKEIKEDARKAVMSILTDPRYFGKSDVLNLWEYLEALEKKIDERVK